MSIQPKKNFMRKLVSIAGVASATVALSFPALALPNGNANSSNQRFNAQASQTDIVAQQSGSDRPNTDTNNNTNNNTDTNQRSTTGGTNNTDRRSTDTNNTNPRPDTSTMEENGRVNRRLLTGGDSVRGVIFRCLHNPNPNCSS